MAENVSDSESNVTFNIDDIYEEENPLFEVQAYLDLSKHIGGTKTTDELLQACEITEDSNVLDVGCGVGQPPVYIAQKYKCKVTGIDVSARMIQRAKERKQKNDAIKTTFLEADASKTLPFEDNTFDIVMTESVLNFIENKEHALLEFKRVAKPNGCIGLNEVYLINDEKTPPEKILDTLNNSEFFQAKIMTEKDYRQLFEKVSLPLVYDRTGSIKAADEAKNLADRFGWWHIIKTTFKTLFLALTKKKHRKYLAESRDTPKELPKYLRYGIFVLKNEGKNS
jgi:ubiquinone/menaquinone biosynthesis C-methylase UbiE